MPRMTQHRRVAARFNKPAGCRRHVVLPALFLFLMGCAGAPERDLGLSLDESVPPRALVQDNQSEDEAPNQGQGKIEDRAKEAFEPQEFNPFFPVGNYSAPFATRTHLTGDWSGLRTRLADNGVLVHAEGSLTGASVHWPGLVWTWRNTAMRIPSERSTRSRI